MAVTLGGSGGNGGLGGNAGAYSVGNIATLGNMSDAVFAQSVGGSGGNGGFSVALSGTTGRDYLVPVTLFVRTTYPDGHVADFTFDSTFSVTVNFAAQNG